MLQKEREITNTKYFNNSPEPSCPLIRVLHFSDLTTSLGKTLLLALRFQVHVLASCASFASTTPTSFPHQLALFRDLLKVLIVVLVSFTFMPLSRQPLVIATFHLRGLRPFLC